MRNALLDKRGGKKRPADLELDRLRSELAKKNDETAELTETLIQEKKGLLNYLRPNGSLRK